MGSFEQWIGIDYSGAQTSSSRQSSLQVYASAGGPPERVSPHGSNKQQRNWNRSEIATWLMEQARSGSRFVAGIDHGFSFPLSYFERYGLTSWPDFLDDFVAHWPTHEPGITVDDIRVRGNSGSSRLGRNDELRLTERWTSSAKSVFLFDVQGSVAKSTHAGLPLLWRIRQEVGDRVHFWPFDGWQIPDDKSVLAEVYPSIFRKRYSNAQRTPDQQDAFAIASWLVERDKGGFLDAYFLPMLSESERKMAELEGWILGIL